MYETPMGVEKLKTVRAPYSVDAGTDLGLVVVHGNLVHAQRLECGKLTVARCACVALRVLMLRVLRYYGVFLGGAGGPFSCACCHSL